jgi:hypothetical protein
MAWVKEGEMFEEVDGLLHKILDLQQIKELLKKGGSIRIRGGRRSGAYKVWGRNIRQDWEVERERLSSARRCVMPKMRTTPETIEEMGRLYEAYEREVKARKNEGILTHKTVNTYLPHAWRFIRWCKGEFIPGIRKLERKSAR